MVRIYFTFNFGQFKISGVLACQRKGIRNITLCQYQKDLVVFYIKQPSGQLIVGFSSQHLIWSGVWCCATMQIMLCIYNVSKA